MMKTSLLPWVVLMSCAALGCKQSALTRGEASQAFEESQASSQAMRLTSGSIEFSGEEITTSFTIGDAAAEAAQTLRDFYESQLPCADVSLQSRTVTIDYGVNGVCLFNGQVYTGSHALTLADLDRTQIVVVHEWSRLSNGVVEVTGEATVTWDLDDPSRRVEHELTWTRLEDDLVGVGSGDRTQRPLAGGLVEGFSVDGTRRWEGERGTWDLSINEVEMRWVDAVPQEGSYSLDTPFDKQLSVGFKRKDVDTITVTVASGQRSFDFDVTSGPD